ncbi:hypothetical protein BDV12DRAFT_197730 [Aspergillus spectabilis]
MNTPPLRSCTLCRTRKIKCDRQQPCTNCIRAECPCIYPAGVGRAPKRPRKAVEAQLLAQLARLEGVVKRMEAQSSRSGSYLTAGGDGDAESGEGQGKEKETDVEGQFGRLVIDDMQSCYVSSVPWTKLGDEIEELRDILHDSTATSDDEDSTVMETSGANAAIMGFRALTHSLHVYHPPVTQAVALFDVFKMNVSPVARVFHIPTLDGLFWDAMAAVESIDKNIEALLFAIYYSAVISLDSEQCLNLLGISRSSALETYRFAVEQAMARADLLNTQNLILLQAAVLFLTALRNEDNSRTVWSLTSLVYHIAQAMGVHRDGEAFGLRPLETELRRRLWWHIVLLDNRSTDYHGCEPIVHESVFDTKIPLNINDADLTADMTQPPPEREEATDMTFCLMRCDAMRVIWKIGYMAPGRSSTSADPRPSPCDREPFAEEFQNRLQTRYLNHCSEPTPFLQLCSTVANVMILRMWTAVLAPRVRKDRSTRDRVFNDSIQVLQLSASLLMRKDVRSWAWYSKTHIQWHAVVFVLAELCWRPPSDECDRAWECVTAVYDRWSTMETEKRGTVWRPIRRLMARARYVRETQKMPVGIQHPITDTDGSWRVAGGSTPTGTGNDDAGQIIAWQDMSMIQPKADLDWENMHLTGGVPVDSWMNMAMLPPNAAEMFDTTVVDLFGYLGHTNGVPGTSGYIPNTSNLSSQRSLNDRIKYIIDA